MEARCPDCAKETGGEGPILESLESNHHGTGTDYMECPACLRAYAVTYKVDTVTRDEAWEMGDEDEDDDETED